MRSAEAWAFYSVVTTMGTQIIPEAVIDAAFVVNGDARSASDEARVRLTE